ncbi:vacuolar protein sorting-associated protein 45 [Nematocida parisii]|nr:vacuolar protein sorting-associated protein 45 [Nematocida parisii]KAI5144986.1 vacuolar protein sorting-associated protein 45 [Nematocida parisii]
MDSLLEDIRNALGRGDGIKALLLDEYTRDSISPIISHAELLSYDFFLFETIRSTRQPIDVSCVAILSKTSLPLLAEEVQKQVYKEYYVFITDELSDAEIEEIAKKDINGIIKELQELYFPGIPVDDNLIILNGTNDQEIAQSLACLLKGLNVSPRIRYLFGSELSYKTAMYIDAGAKCKSTNSDILILDRVVDLFTPIMYPWTYQSMAAEYLEYKPGMITWGHNNLCISRDDKFFKECKFKDIVYATERLKDSFEDVKVSRELAGEFITNVKNKAKESNRLTMHLKAITEISNACVENDSVSEAMADLIEDVPINLLESIKEATEQQKLRLALIEYLCEVTARSPNILKTLWKDKQQKWILFDGYKKEIELFTKTYIKNYQNLRRPSYERNQSRKLGYIPELVRIITDLKNNRLSTTKYPIVRNIPGNRKTIIVFMGGGISFIEYRALVLLFTKEFPKNDILLISNKIITANEILSSISVRPKY